ncbi:unnamed protein product [Protopolystoma xenopodis]|uniref:Uncharacterized protein n=1 Tax=Protopolystoma xenopodis TaxID=117903 RepID=A0A448WZH0_9PLAT|nr:unnamed protein product [Protopolystoma xenopodis]
MSIPVSFSDCAGTRPLRGGSAVLLFPWICHELESLTMARNGLLMSQQQHLNHHQQHKLLSNGRLTDMQSASVHLLSGGPGPQHQLPQFLPQRLPSPHLRRLGSHHSRPTQPNILLPDPGQTPIRPAVGASHSASTSSGRLPHRLLITAVLPRVFSRLQQLASICRKLAHCTKDASNKEFNTLTINGAGLKTGVRSESIDSSQKHCTGKMATPLWALPLPIRQARTILANLAWLARREIATVINSTYDPRPDKVIKGKGLGTGTGLGGGGDDGGRCRNGADDRSRSKFSDAKMAKLHEFGGCHLWLLPSLAEHVLELVKLASCMPDIRVRLVCFLLYFAQFLYIL